VERMGLLDYLDDVWSDIWDLIVMEVDELRSIIPSQNKPHFYFSLHFSGKTQEIKAGIEQERFVEEFEPGIFHIITAEGWKQASEDGKGRIILDRIVLREVVCRSWDEESYELLYNVDEGRGFESMQEDLFGEGWDDRPL
jgi:hypothetical protein